MANAGQFVKGQKRPGQGQGRPKGPTKTTIEVKQAILAALDKVGGVDYLVAQAQNNPGAFLTLVGKVIPLQVTGQDGGPVQTVTRIEIVALK